MVYRVIAWIVFLLTSWVFIVKPLVTFPQLFQAAIPIFSTQTLTARVPVYVVVGIGIYLVVLLIKYL